MPLTVSGHRADSYSRSIPADAADRRWIDRAQGATYGVAAAALMPVYLTYDSVRDVATGLTKPGSRGLMVQGAFEGMAAATTALWLPATLSVGCMLGAALGFRAVRYMMEPPILLLGELERATRKQP